MATDGLHPQAQTVLDRWERFGPSSICLGRRRPDGHGARRSKVDWSLISFVGNPVGVRFGDAQTMLGVTVMFVQTIDSRNPQRIPSNRLCQSFFGNKPLWTFYSSQLV